MVNYTKEQREHRESWVTDSFQHGWSWLSRCLSLLWIVVQVQHILKHCRNFFINLKFGNFILPLSSACIPKVQMISVNGDNNPLLFAFLILKPKKKRKGAARLNSVGSFINSSLIRTWDDTFDVKQEYERDCDSYCSYTVWFLVNTFFLAHVDNTMDLQLPPSTNRGQKTLKKNKQKKQNCFLLIKLVCLFQFNRMEWLSGKPISFQVQHPLLI